MSALEPVVMVPVPPATVVVLADAVAALDVLALGLLLRIQVRGSVTARDLPTFYGVEPHNGWLMARQTLVDAGLANVVPPPPGGRIERLVLADDARAIVWGGLA